MTRPLNIFVPHCSSLLTDHLPHGDGLVANGFLRHLAARGHNLHVVAERVDVNQSFPPNLRVTALNQEGRTGLTYRVSYVRRMRHHYRQLSRTVPFDIIHQLNPVFTGVSLALLGERPPVVLGPYVARWPDDPDSATAASGKLTSLVVAGRTALSRWQQSRAARLLLTTPAAQDRIPGFERAAARIRMLPHGLDTGYFVPARERTNTEDILFLSNLVERKGIFDLLKAFDLIAPEFPRARLLIGGDGPEMQKAKALAGAISGRARVIFLGRQSRSESLAALQQCGLFCQPSLGEPFGMSAAEAMACGKPLIVTAAGGLKYFIDEAGGLHVPVGNPAELARALRTLLKDASLRSAMGEHNRRRIVEWMSWERVAARLEDVYAELLPLKRSSSFTLGG